jgi:hypothetical protein
MVAYPKLHNPRENQLASLTASLLQMLTEQRWRVNLRDNGIRNDFLTISYRYARQQSVLSLWSQIGRLLLTVKNPAYRRGGIS